MKDLKLYYDRKDFQSIDSAQANFLRNWMTDNPHIKQQVDEKGESEIAKNYQGAHYRGGRWYFCTKVNNFMNLDSIQDQSRTDSIIKKCPRCGNLGSVRSGGWVVSEIFLHISSIENNEEIAIVFCQIPHQKMSGLIDASS